ncbi:MAG TPA: MCP four helix bundle domain-containing protein [bacterium]|nr:MCP four helix bundle domain-containing protein [bacterium]
MKLRAKIISGFIILALMLSIAGVWSIFELKSMGKTVLGFLDENYKSIDATKTMIEALEREDSAILLLLLGDRQEGINILASADSLFKSGFETARNNVTIAGEQTLIDSIKIQYQAYTHLWEKHMRDNRREENLNRYFQNFHTPFLDLKTTLRALMTLNHQFMFRTASDLNDKANRAIMPGVVAVLAALIFTALFSHFVHVYFVNPIIKMNKSIKNVLDHKAAFTVEIETNDEIGELASSLKKLSDLFKN